MTASFEHTSHIHAPPDMVFAWHEREGAFERLMPPWERIRVVEKEGGIEDGGRLVMKMKKGPAWLRWEALHRDFEPGRQFVDEQVRGPFSAWRHTHRFRSDGNGGTVLEDHIDYRLPGGPLGRLLAGRSTRRALESTFEPAAAASSATSSATRGSPTAAR